MPNLGLPELIVIFVIVVLVFGVGRLGEVGGALGKGIREFKKASSYDPSEDESLKKPAQIAEKTDEEKKAE
jgi:sec-independent protein translocase protein TatA